MIYLSNLIRGLAITTVLIIFANLLDGMSTYELTYWHIGFLGAAGGVLGVETE